MNQYISKYAEQIVSSLPGYSAPGYQLQHANINNNITILCRVRLNALLSVLHPMLCIRVLRCLKKCPVITNQDITNVCFKLQNRFNFPMAGCEISILLSPHKNNFIYKSTLNKSKF